MTNEYEIKTEIPVTDATEMMGIAMLHLQHLDESMLRHRIEAYTETVKQCDPEDWIRLKEVQGMLGMYKALLFQLKYFSPENMSKKFGLPPSELCVNEDEQYGEIES